MKIITFKDIKELHISPMKCFEWAKYMIENKNNTCLPSKISFNAMNGSFCTFMPSLISGEGGAWEGVKVVTRVPNRIPSLESAVLLMSQENNEFLAIMDGTWITAMRTGAVAVHSILNFAKPSFTTIGMMGLGNVARATLLILADKMPEREITIKLVKYKGQEKDFSERFYDYKNFRFVFVDSVEDMVKGSEVVISATTYLSEDVCEDRFFDKGVLVQPIHTRGFTNCDLFFDKVFVDDIGHVRKFQNFGKFKKVGEVCDVVNGVIPGRVNDDERILVYNVGISIHDMYFASSIYQLMQKRGFLDELSEIDLEYPVEKFWV